MNRPLRIAYLVDGFAVLSETFIMSQIRGAIARGHDVQIYACSEPPPSAIASAVDDSELLARVHYLPTPAAFRHRLRVAMRGLAQRGWRSPAMCLRAMSVFTGGKQAGSGRLLCSALPFAGDAPRRYDVIHSQFGPLGRLALQLRRIGAWRGALVTAFRGYDATQYLRLHPHAYETLFRHGELFLPVSSALRSVLLTHGCPPDRTQVHHSGIDCARFEFRVRTRAAGEPTRLLSVARLVEKKGIEYAIAAVGRLQRAGLAVEYDIIGDGPCRLALAQLIETSGLQATVRLLGWRQPEEVQQRLAAAHLLVAPSVTADNGDQEGIPNVLKEAMATGMPVVATYHGGNAELVEHDVSGLLVPERNVEALATALQTLISTPERWSAMGAAGRRRVDAEFDSVTLGHTLDRLYEQAIQRGTTHADGGQPLAASIAREG